jgi:hypothetical protein
MMLKPILIAGCAILLTGTANAQAPQKAQTQTQSQQKAAPAAAPAQSGPPASALAAAKEYLQIKRVFTFYEGIVVGTIQNVKNSLTQSNLMLQRDINEISLKLASDLKGREAEIIDGMAVIYANDFTEQELRDLIAFYKTPLGKKSIEQDPKSVDASLNYLKNWGDDFSVEVNSRFAEELKKRGKEL